MRDWLLDRSDNCDYDIVTELSVIELADALYELNISDDLPVTYPRFGTVKLSIAGYTVELVTARKESYKGSSRKPEVETASLRDDVFRRDFTINCLLYNLHTQEILDLTGLGLRDLQLGVLRTPVPPEQTFHDDPLRILRAVRFMAQLGFEPVEPLVQAAKGMAPRLSIISGERIREELQRAIRARYADDALYAMSEWGLWPALIGSNSAIGRFEWISDVPVALRWPYALYPICGEIIVIERLAKRLRLSGDEASALRAFWRVASHHDHIDRLVTCHRHLEPIIAVSSVASLMTKQQLELLTEMACRKPESPIDGHVIMELRPELPVAQIGRIKAHLVRMVLTGQIDPSDQDAARHEVKRWNP